VGLPAHGGLCNLLSMSAPLLCRLGYHRFGPWDTLSLKDTSNLSVKSPREQQYHQRRCGRCGMEHTDYSPQEGMQFDPPVSPPS
jgi:hypothetical protein